MKTCGGKITDVLIIDKVLKTLTLRFDHIVVAIEESKNPKSVKVEEFLGSLEANEQRMNGRNVKRAINQERKKINKVERINFRGSNNDSGNNSSFDHTGLSQNFGKGTSKEGKGKFKRGKRRYDKKKCSVMLAKSMSILHMNVRERMEVKKKKNKDEAHMAPNDGPKLDSMLLMVIIISNINCSNTWYLGTSTPII
ncbi:hypothetical protein CR513_58388, partial [Mucuna pruriens]